MYRRALIVAALAPAIVAAAPAARARGARVTVPAGFLGAFGDRELLSGRVALGEETQLMARSGVQTLGVAFDWALAQPYPSSGAVPAGEAGMFRDEGGVPTSFAAGDALVAAAAAAGLRVFPVLTHAPAWARLHPDRNWSPPADPAPYAAFAGALVRRYGPAGSFWTEHPDLVRRPIGDWQVWNEPDVGSNTQNSVFWADDAPFAARYLAMLRAAHDAIKAVDPAARVVLAGLVGRSWETLRGLDGLGAGSYYDVVALHPYTSQPRNVVAIVRNVRAQLDRERRASAGPAKPIAITELGWPAFSGSQVARLNQGARDAFQVYWLRSTLRALVTARSSLRLSLVLWYTWMGTDAGTDPFDYSGLVHIGTRARVTGKPALSAFASLARRWEGR